MVRRNSRARRNKKGFGTSRSALFQAGQSRGRQPHNIWCQYSNRLGRDVVWGSDPAFAHFCLLEGDPQVLSYEPNPEPITVVVGHDTEDITGHALVKMRNGPPELRMVATGPKPDEESLRKTHALERAASQAGFTCVQVTAEYLAPHQQLITNWRCALAVLSSCRTINLQPYISDIESRCRGLHRSTIDELLAGTNPAEKPQYQAAIFTCLQTARLLSDLDQKPLCASTLIWEGPHA